MEYVNAMYSGSAYYSKNDNDLDSKDSKDKNDKLTSRIIGGMKAQKVTSKIINIDGRDFEIPNHEYVVLLEMQIKELKEYINNIEKKYSRLENNTNSLSMRMRLIEDEFRKIPKFRN